jgi:integrase
MPKVVRNALSAAKVRQIREPGRYADGNGLYLHVSETGGRWWVWRGIVKGGKRRELGLTSSPTPEDFDGKLGATEATAVSLAEARAIAAHYRRLARQGIDPAAKRDKDRDRHLTFAQAVDRYLAEKGKEFRNEKHAWQWRTTLAEASKVLGTKRVDQIDVQDVLRVLRPMWEERTETASRLRGRIERVLAWATVNGHRTGDNPARWRGHLAEALPKPSKIAEAGQQPALAQDDLPRWWTSLAARSGTAAAALQFLALTAARSGEVRGMTWAEVDVAKALWTVPGSRMKAGREHRVPLTAEALALLENVRGLDPVLVFPSPQRAAGVGSKPLSDMALAALMRRMHEAEVMQAEETEGAAEGAQPEKPRGFADPRSGRAAVPHGLRSSFRDWAAERGFDHTLAEIALAHDVGSEVERAYRRTDMVERRREMMAAWGRFLRGEPEPENVVQIRGRRA